MAAVDLLRGGKPQPGDRDQEPLGPRGQHGHGVHYNNNSLFGCLKASPPSPDGRQDFVQKDIAAQMVKRD